MTDGVPPAVPVPPPQVVATPMPAAAAHPQPPEMQVPLFRAPDVQMLVQDLAESRRALIEERRNSQNRIAEERERSRFEIEKARNEYGSQVKTLERENDALLRGLGRLQSENDQLREENAVLRHAQSNGKAEEKVPAAVAPAAPLTLQDLAAQFNRGPAKTMVPIIGVQAVPKGAQQVTLQPPPQVMGAPPQGIAP